MKRKNERSNPIYNSIYDPIDDHTNRLFHKDNIWSVMVEGPNTINHVTHSVLDFLRREFHISYVDHRGGPEPSGAATHPPTP